jgi:hypothetical protein
MMTRVESIRTVASPLSWRVAFVPMPRRRAEQQHLGRSEGSAEAMTSLLPTVVQEVSVLGSLLCCTAHSPSLMWASLHPNLGPSCSHSVLGEAASRIRAVGGEGKRTSACAMRVALCVGACVGVAAPS